jgi:hypothetical protein
MFCLTTSGVLGRPAGRPVGTYLAGMFPLTVPAATGTRLKETAETADEAAETALRPGRPRKGRHLPALVLNRVLGGSLRHIEQAVTVTPVNGVTNLDFSTVTSLRNNLQVIPYLR